MQNDDALAVGVDFGTDSARALLVRTCDGEVLASCSHPYARWGKGLYSEAAQMRFRQHPHDYAEALRLTERAIALVSEPRLREDSAVQEIKNELQYRYHRLQRRLKEQ